MKIYMVLGAFLMVLLLGCSSDETGSTENVEDQSSEISSCEDGLDIEESCYLRYIRLGNDEKLCCDSWLQTQRTGE